MRRERSYIDYLEYSKWSELEPSDYELGVAMPPYAHDGFEKKESGLPLPDPLAFRPRLPEFLPLARSRRSSRSHGGFPLGLAELSFILYCADGIHEVKPDKRTKRTVPSAGCRHSFDLFVIANDIEKVERGIYRYDAYANMLFLSDRTDPDFGARLEEACVKQSFVGLSGAVIAISCKRHRTEWLYGRRSWRYLFMESGHISQMIALASTAVGYGSCAVGAFDDDRLHDLLGLPADSDVLSLSTVGRP